MMKSQTISFIIKNELKCFLDEQTNDIKKDNDKIIISISFKNNDNDFWSFSKHVKFEPSN